MSPNFKQKKIDYETAVSETNTNNRSTLRSKFVIILSMYTAIPLRDWLI